MTNPGQFSATFNNAPRNDDQLPSDRLADMLRAAATERSERTNAFAAVLERYPPDAYADLILCDLCERMGVPEIAEAALDRALTTDLAGEIVLRFRLSAAAMRRGRPAAVIDLLEGHVDPAVASPERNRLARAHAMVSPPRVSGVKFFAAIRKHAMDDADLQMAGGLYHLNRGAIKEAIPWFRRALAASPGEAHLIIRLWIALKRDGADARARRLLEDIDLDALKGEPLDRLQVARLLWQIGRIEALDFAYEIAVRALDDPDICLAYSHLILSDAFHPSAPELVAPKRVEVGVWVRLSRRVGATFDFVLVDENDDVPFHFTVDHAIAAAAVGRVVGDTFETVDGPIRSEWTIEELKPKAIYLFHQISATFQDRFPGHGGLWAMTMVENDIEPILESLRQRRAQVERLEAIYLSHPVPLGTVARAGGGGTIDFAMHLARRGLGVVSSTGYADDTAAERRVAAKAAGHPIVLDAYTLWLLAKFTLLDAILQVYPRILVPQSALDELSALIEARKEMFEGRKTVAAEGDGFILVEASAEEVANEATDLATLREYIRTRADVVSIEAPDSFSSEILQLADMLGNQFDCLSVAAREEAVLVAADLRLRQVATAICTLPTFGLDALIEELATREALDNRRRVETILSLCELGHSFVGLNAITLFWILRHDGTEALHRFERAARYLGTANADPVSHISVAAGFTKMAAKELGTSVRAQAAIGIVLSKLVRMSSIPLSETIGLFVSLTDTPSVTRYVHDWLRGHFLGGIVVAQV